MANLDDTVDLIRACATEIADDEEPAARLHATALLLAERVTELDEALTAGATLPTQWQR